MPPFDDGDFAAAGEPSLREAAPPRFGDWVWRPWYAKLWWFLIVTFWLGAFIAQWVTPLRTIFQNDRFPAVFLLLHPFAALPVLGFGFAREWGRFHAPLPHEDVEAQVRYGPSGLGLRSAAHRDDQPSAQSPG